jgi:hypothetical protein
VITRYGIKSIGSIDSKKSNLTATFNVSTTWKDQRLNEYWSTVFSEAKMNDHNYISSFGGSKGWGLVCPVTEKFLIDLSYLTPRVQPVNFSATLLSAPPQYQLLFMPPESNSCEDSIFSCNDFDWEFGVSIIQETKNYQGIFEQTFDLRKFPFDDQSLQLGLEVEDNMLVVEGAVLLQGNNMTDESLDTFMVARFKSDEWQLNDFVTGTGYSYSDWAEQRVPFFSVLFHFKRNSFYYVVKLLVPILLLLTITWSAFWIDPKNLEARVTITVVSFLALIAYNFVIDQDLPKLGYLTLMDSIILTSYVFAGIPTLTSVFLRYRIDNGRDTGFLRVDVHKFDRWCSLIVPLGYFGSILIVAGYFLY